MSVKSIIGVYDFERDKVMSLPKHPTAHQMDEKQYDFWVKQYKDEYQIPLKDLKKKIVHVSYKKFKDALENTVTQFKKATGPKFYCVSLVQPGKSQKWVTEVAMKKGFKAGAYVCLGEEDANNLKYALKDIHKKDSRFKHVVLIDDGSFTGNQMFNNVSSAHSILKEKFSASSTFHILIPYITQAALQKLKTLSKKGVDVRLYTSEVMPLISESVEKRHLQKLLEVLWPHLKEKERKEQSNSTALHWFDHKMPNSMSFPDVLARGTVTKSKKEKDATDQISFLPDVLPPYKS